MRKLFLLIGILSFVGGGYYIGQNYTVVQIDPTHIARAGTTTLQSSFFGTPIEVGTDDAQVAFRIGSFALVRNPKPVLIPVK